jgi:GH43 family beta-xylosidase
MVTKTTFRNLLRVEARKSRVLVHSGADPWVVYKGGWYYYCRVVDDWQIIVNRSRRLADIGKRSHVVWEHPLRKADAEVWAPELHLVRGKWYIYFTMGRAEQHRMYVLEAQTDNPQGTYELKGKITDATDKWAIDGTVFEQNGKLYCVWSGWEGDSELEPQNLYIATMSNPWTIDSERVCIAKPQHAWEKATALGLPDVNEGPEVLQRNGKTFIIYSASHSLTDDYCLGQLTLEGANPLSEKAWIKKPQPVFYKKHNSFGPGHASFTKGWNGQDWIVYHTAKHSNAGWDRHVRAQRFTWSADGSPNFGMPLPIKTPLLRSVVAARKQPLLTT